VVLAPGATAHTRLAIHDVSSYAKRACDPADTAELRLATTAALSFEACSRAGIVYMSIVGPIRTGAGNING
jgi:hypothetical protein